MLSKAQIKTIHALRQKKYRRLYGRFPVEGVKPVAEMLKENHIRVDRIFALGSWIRAHPGLSRGPAGPEVTEVSETELEQISWLETPQEVLALCEIPAALPPPDPAGRITLALDAVRDPGNLGTIIRIADWFGLGEVVLSPDCADPYSPKTVQAAKGSLARIRVCETSLTGWLDAYPEAAVLVSLLEGEPVTRLAHLTEAVLVIGNESAGVSPAIEARASRRITIPRLGGAESLNAAVATAILLERLLL